MCAIFPGCMTPGFGWVGTFITLAVPWPEGLSQNGNGPASVYVFITHPTTRTLSDWGGNCYIHNPKLFHSSIPYWSHKQNPPAHLEDYKYMTKPTRVCFVDCFLLFMLMAYWDVSVREAARGGDGRLSLQTSPINRINIPSHKR